MTTHKKLSEANQHRLKRLRQDGQSGVSGGTGISSNSVLDCGWGRLIFGQTFESKEDLVKTLRAESPDRRDIVFYASEPQVTLALAPQDVFLDPSLTYRLDFTSYRPARHRRQVYSVRRLATQEDAEAVNLIYSERNMVPVDPDFFLEHRDSRTLITMVAEDRDSGAILGAVTGVDHSRAFSDPEKGSSLWCLAVSPTAPHAGIGESLVRKLIEHFQARGANHLDLSVMHDNEQAIALYKKLGFRRVPVYAIKRKNPINEKLFVGANGNDKFNPYAQIIVNEARRRGIGVKVIDAEAGLFQLNYGGRSVRCRESLSEFTTAVALSICDDKSLTHSLVKEAGVRVPEQITVKPGGDWRPFVDSQEGVVVKPMRGEQGKGVAVGLTTYEDVEAAIEQARTICDTIVIEQYVPGEDLRLVVIDDEVVAGAIRRPARIVGDGVSTVKKLIEAQSRRRAAATGGESQIRIDAETERCLERANLTLSDVLDNGQEVAVRKTANLHTGGTIEDVTAQLHPDLIEAATLAARAIDIPVTGIDFIVKSPRDPEYVFIEANERPGLANHEPQPTAERFVDLLFPLSVPGGKRESGRGAGQ